MANSNSFLTNFLNSGSSTTKTETSTTLADNSSKSNSFLSNFISSGSNATATSGSTKTSSNSFLSNFLKADDTDENYNTNGFIGGIGYTLWKAGLGILQSIEGIWDYTASGIAKLFGADDFAEAQVANDWVNYNHADEWYNPSSGWQVAGDVASGIGTSIPAIAGVAALTWASGGTLTPFVSTLVSSTIAGLSASGGALKEAYQETGELGGKEYAYAAASGALEGVVEGFEDITGFGTGTVIDNIATTFSKRTVGTLAKNSFTTTLIKSFVGEAAEEGIEGLITPYLKRMTYDPDAESASLSEVGYSALIGGLSGMLMGGFSAGVSTTTSIARGNKIISKGSTNDVLETAKNLTAYQEKNNTDYESLQAVKDLYTELTASMEKTGGQVSTIKQKQLLGELERANTLSAFEPMVVSSAQQIYENAEQVAKEYSKLYKTKDGKAITITAEELTEGIDNSSPKAFKKSFKQALKTNSKLRGIAILDATGQVLLDTKEFADATARGEAMFGQSDTNYFFENATDEEMDAVAAQFGIDDWNTLTADELKTKMVNYARNGGIENFQAERKTVQQLSAQAEATTESKSKLPYRLNLDQDGAYRYTTGDGIDLAIIKQGDNYRIYDYNEKRMSKSLTEQQANKALNDIRTAYNAAVTQAEQANARARIQAIQAQHGVNTKSTTTQDAQSATQTNESTDTKTGEQTDTKSAQNGKQAAETETKKENARQKQARELDEFAREHVIGYNKLSARNQSMIRSLLRQGRMLGKSDDVLISYANISAHSGLNIVFMDDIEGDGKVDLDGNRIYVKTTMKSRSYEMALIHELEHKLFNKKNGEERELIGTKGIDKYFTAEEKEKVRKTYTDFYHSRGEVVSDFIIADEEQAAYAEKMLSNKNVLERLVADKPTIKEKILNFFKGAKSDYAGDAKLSRAANKLYKQFKKLFDEFSAQNYQTNAVSANQTRGFNIDKYGNITDVTQTQSEKAEAARDAAKTKTKTETESRYAVKKSTDGDMFVEVEKQTVNAEMTPEEIADTLTDIVNKKYTSFVDVHGQKIGINQRTKNEWLKSKSAQALLRTDNQAYLDKVNAFNNADELLNSSKEYIGEKKNHSRKDNFVEFARGIVDFKVGNNGYEADIIVGTTKNGVAILYDIVNLQHKKIVADTTYMAQDHRQAISATSNNSISNPDENVNTQEQNSSENDTKRYALPETDSQGNTLTAQQREYFKDSKVRDKDGKLLIVYHGTSAEFYTFDRDRQQYGTQLYGAGYYFATNINATQYYGNRKIDAYLNIKNPFVITNKSNANDFYDYPLTENQAYRILNKHPLINDTENSPLGDFSERYWKEGATQSVKREVAKQITEIGYLTDLNLFSRYPTEMHEAITEVLGYDGIRVDFENGDSFFVAWYENQIKSTTNTAPTAYNDIRFALPEVDPVEPTSNAWKPTIDTYEAKARFPSLWDVTADSSEVRNPTQISSTVKTYRKIYDYLKRNNFDGTILDASSGLGYGTRAGIEEYGFKVDDIEPYPDASYKPKYTDYSTLNKKYDVIISNAVLNVLPQDQRNALVMKMGELLKDGGTMFINVRGEDVNTLSSNADNVKISEREWFVASTGSYQKGFTKNELVAYLRDALGDNYTVEKANFFGGVAVTVTKNASTENSNVRYALPETLNKLGDYDSVRAERITSRNGDTISRNYEEIISFIKNAKSGDPDTRLHIGIINNDTAALVKEKTGIDITDYELVLSSSNIVHIFNRHGKSIESLSGQIQVTYDNIENIIEAVIDPENVYLDTDNSGNKSLVFEKSVNGKNVAITVVSTKKSALTLKSARIMKSSKNTPSANAYARASTSETNSRQLTGSENTPSANAEARARTSETNSRQLATNSISDTEEKSNPKTKKTSKNIRYALPEDTDLWSEDTDGRTDAEKKQILSTARETIQDYTVDKTYSKTEVEQIINTAVAYTLDPETNEFSAYIEDTTKAEAVEKLWKGINSAKTPEQAASLIKDTASYILSSALAENTESTPEIEQAKTTIAALKPLLHSVNLKNIKGEIKYNYDTDAKSLYLLWGKKNGGTSPDTIYQQYADYGARQATEGDISTSIGITLKGTEEDIFIIDKAYREAVKTIDDGSQALLKGTATRKEYADIKAELESVIAASMEIKGTETTYSKLDNKNDIKTLTDLTETLFEAHQEEQAEIDALSKKIDAMTARIRDLDESAKLNYDIRKAKTEELSAAQKENQELKQRLEKQKDIMQKQLDKLKAKQEERLAKQKAEFKDKVKEARTKANKEAARWRNKYEESKAYNSEVNKVLYKTEKLRAVKTGEAINSTQYKGNIFSHSIGQLTRIKYRGDFNSTGTRKAFAGLQSWYTQDNPLLMGSVDADGNRSNGYYNPEVAQMLANIADNEKPLTDAQSELINGLMERSGAKTYTELRDWYTRINLKGEYDADTKNLIRELANPTSYTVEELQQINNLIAYFTHFIETYNRIYRNGQLVDALPVAQENIRIMNENKNIKLGIFGRFMNTVFNHQKDGNGKGIGSYMDMFADPMTVARNHDYYQDGFYTQTMQSFREATYGAAITEMQMRENVDNFYDEHKQWRKELAKRTVTYNGVEMPATDAISLYLTLSRRQAQAGLAVSGYAFIDTDGNTKRAKGFAEGIDLTEITPDELNTLAMQEQQKLSKEFTATDKEFLGIVEDLFNNEDNEYSSKSLKYKTDMKLNGYSNVQQDYYFPIYRAFIGKTIDTSLINESDRVSNLGFNKNTVSGAKNELYIEPIDRVLDTHVKGIAMYANMATTIRDFDILFNIDTGGNPNKTTSIRTEAQNDWRGAERYFKTLLSDMQGVSPVKGGTGIMGRLRSGYAKSVLGANPKVWATQFSSVLASTSRLDFTSIMKGAALIASQTSDLDEYCLLAKVRNTENTAALAQGILDTTGKVGDILMKPIGATDRFVVKWVYAAAQLQVEKEQGLKVGTKENKVAAGKLTQEVILETQQNAMATERSAAMRSGSELLKSITMFSSDAMKVVGRVIDAVGERTVLRARISATTDAAVKTELQARLKEVNKNLRKSLGALTTSAIFMALIAQAFRSLYNKDKDIEDDEDYGLQVLKNMGVDALGNLVGGLPIIKDLYSYIADGYDVEDYSYSTINDILDSVGDLIDLAEDMFSGDLTTRDVTSAIKTALFSLGKVVGLPVRQVYNVVYGLTSRVSESAAYVIDDAFSQQSYVSDLAKAIENDDTKLAGTILELLLEDRTDASLSDSATAKILELYKAGYTSILPKSISTTITYNGEEIALTGDQLKAFESTYYAVNEELETMLGSTTFTSLTEQQQAKAVQLLYNAYYYKALSELTLEDNNTTVGTLSNYMDASTAAVAYAVIATATSDTDEDGNTISGSKKANIIVALQQQGLSDGEVLFILCYSAGYTIQDGDYKGYTAKRAKKLLLNYILKLNLTQTEKAAIAEECGFTVKNNRIITSDL